MTVYKCVSDTYDGVKLRTIFRQPCLFFSEAHELQLWLSVII